MGMAETIAERGTCSRAQVGAIIVRDSRLISSGYNGVPAGMRHCDHSLDGWGDGPNSPRNPGCLMSVHAEANAIAFAARYGSTVDACEMFTTHQPCLDCAKLIINAGILRVVFWKPYRRSEGLDLLNAANVATMRTDPWG